MIGAVFFNDNRGSYQASSWIPALPLLCKIAKWKTVGLIYFKNEAVNRKHSVRWFRLCIEITFFIYSQKFDKEPENE